MEPTHTFFLHAPIGDLGKTVGVIGLCMRAKSVAAARMQQTRGSARRGGVEGNWVDLKVVSS